MQGERRCRKPYWLSEAGRLASHMSHMPGGCSQMFWAPWCLFGAECDAPSSLHLPAHVGLQRLEGHGLRHVEVTLPCEPVQLPRVPHVEVVGQVPQPKKELEQGSARTRRPAHTYLLPQKGACASVPGRREACTPTCSSAPACKAGRAEAHTIGWTVGETREAIPAQIVCLIIVAPWQVSRLQKNVFGMRPRGDRLEAIEAQAHGCRSDRVQSACENIQHKPFPELR